MILLKSRETNRRGRRMKEKETTVAIVDAYLLPTYGLKFVVICFVVLER